MPTRLSLLDDDDDDKETTQNVNVHHILRWIMGSNYVIELGAIWCNGFLRWMSLWLCQSLAVGTLRHLRTVLHKCMALIKTKDHQWHILYYSFLKIFLSKLLKKKLSNWIKLFTIKKNDQLFHYSYIHIFPIIFFYLDSIISYILFFH